MGTSSADPDQLDTYVAASRELGEGLRRRLGGLAATYQRVVPRLQWGVFDASATLGDLASYLALNDADDEWVSAISGRFRAADGGRGGVVTVASESVDAALRAAGVAAGPRADLTVDDPLLAGAPPTSGYANDPVCTATGHFVEHEVDLPVPPRVVLAGWARTYSSRWLEPGPFGRGWASWASVRVSPLSDGVALCLPDGRRAWFRSLPGGDFERVVGLPADLGACGDGWELRWFDGDRWRVDACGRPVRVASPARGAVTMSWDGPRLVRIAHEGGRWVRLEWSCDRVGCVRSSDGRVVRYAYDDAGDLVSVSAPHVGLRRYEVEDGLVVAVTDADGVELVRNGYDPDGRVRWQRSPFGRRTTFRYPARGVTVVDDAEDGPVVTHLHDRRGRLVGAIDDHGARLTKAYDPWGHPVASADRTGAAVAQVWDPRGRLLRRQEPDGSVTRLEWDEQDRIVARTDAVGATARLAYAGDARVPCRVVDAAGGVTTVEVVGGQVMGVVDPDGVVTRFTRNGDGLITAVLDGLGRRTTYEYEAAGGLVRSVGPDGAERRWDLDDGGRVVRRYDGDGTSVGFSWTAAGRLEAVESATGHRSAFRYGAHGAVTEVEDPWGAVSTLEWDPLGHLVALTDAAGAVVRHRYDGLGRLVSTVDATGAELRREHDAEGRVVALVNGEGEVQRRTYDACGRLASTSVDGVEAARFVRDRAGRLVAVVDAGTIVGFVRDACGRVVAAVGPDGSATRYRWTPGGRLHSVTAPSGARVEHRYDRAGRLIEVVGPGALRRRYERDRAGRIVAVVDGVTGARTSYELDPCGRVVARTDPSGRTTRWTHHPSGRVASCTNPDGGTSWFGWDAAGRLVSAVDPNGGETTYRWNPSGSIVSVTDPLGGVQRHEVDAMGRLTAWTDQLGHRTELVVDRAGRLAGHRDPTGAELRFARDPAGRITAWTSSRSGAHVVPPAPAERGSVLSAGNDVPCRSPHSEPQWDRAGQLIGLRDGAGRRWSWEYDAAGRRTVQRSPFGTDRYRWDAAGRLLEVVRHGSEPAVTWYQHDAAGRRVREVRCGLRGVTSVRYGWDDFGRLREIRRREGSASEEVTRLRLDERGSLLGIEGDLGPLRWLHHRTLDTETGTFLSPDPLAGVPGTPVVAFPYHYAANDPLRLSDPLGLQPMTDADLEALRESASRPAWQKAYDSAQDLVDDPGRWAREHWETIAAVGLVVIGGVLVATGVGAPLGAGALVGASMAFSSQVALEGEVDQRSLLVSTASGAIGGGIGGATSAMAVGTQVAIGAGTDMALSAGAQYATAGTVDPGQVLLDGVIGGTTAGVGTSLPWAPEPTPFGFGGRSGYLAFGRELHAGLAEAGYADIETAIRGSSVTGVRYRSQVPIDVVRGPNDIDVALVGPRLMDDARAVGIEMWNGGARTPRLETEQLEPLGLAALEQQLSDKVGRHVSFMAYRDFDAVRKRPDFYRMIP